MKKRTRADSENDTPVLPKTEDAQGESTDDLTSTRSGCLGNCRKCQGPHSACAASCSHEGPCICEACFEERHLATDEALTQGSKRPNLSAPWKANTSGQVTVSRRLVCEVCGKRFGQLISDKIGPQHTCDSCSTHLALYNSSEPSEPSHRNLT